MNRREHYELAEAFAGDAVGCIGKNLAMVEVYTDLAKVHAALAGVTKEVGDK